MRNEYKTKNISPWPSFFPGSTSLLNLLPFEVEHGFSMGCCFFQGMSTCCRVGSSMGCSVHLCSAMVLHGLQRDNLLHHVLPGTAGESLLTVPGASFPTLFTDLGVCRAVSCFLLPPSQLLHSNLYLFLNMLSLITEVPPVLLMGSTLASGVSLWSWL